MAHITIPDGDVDQGSIVDESLMKDKIKNNDDDHETRITALEALGGGGGGGSAAVDSPYATILAGAEDNVAEFWKVRHHPAGSAVQASLSKDHSDFEGTDTGTRWRFDPNFTNVSAVYGAADVYLGTEFLIEQNEQIQFKIKKGENFFCIGTATSAASATLWRVYVDGVNVNTLGLTDETGAVVPSSFSTNSATTLYGKVFHLYGLDGEEHMITIKNENGSAQEVRINFVDVGYRSPDYAIDHTIKVNAGAANVNGIDASFNEATYSFTKPGEGLANGYTGMLKVNQSGTITAVDGLSPASTQCKPNEEIEFSAGPVTSLLVKNHFDFITAGGICLYSQPAGDTYLFSYSSKTDPSPANQTFEGIVWQSQPTENFTPLKERAGATNWVTSEFRGEGRIEYWAKAPILIDGTNNKVDFEITVNGVQTTHAATIASGWYSADLVPLEAAFKTAMQAVKSINGEYFLKYNEDSQLWSLGTSDPEVSEINFEWATGANSGSTFGSVLGFSSDSSGQTTYVSPLVKQHKAQRVFFEEDEVRHSEHTSIKYNFARSSSTQDSEADSLILRTQFPTYRRISTTSVVIDIFPDEDCCGMTISAMRDSQGTYATYQVDAGKQVWLGTTGTPIDVAVPSVGSMVNWFISFPKGSHKITVRWENQSMFETESTSNTLTFFGYRQHFTKPPWESLAEEEKILKTFEVAPLRLYGTRYGHNTALYTPQPSDDNINNITESGTWTQTTVATLFNQRDRRTTTDGGYMEVEFVLQGDGGGIGMMHYQGPSEADDVNYFISDTSINETTDQIDKKILLTGIFSYDQSLTRFLGLKAGTYFMRMKQEDTVRLTNSAIEIFDTVPPQVNARTNTDINNTGQSVAFPLHTKKRNCQRYGAIKRPANYAEGEFNEGLVHHFDYSDGGHLEINYHNEGGWGNRGNQYWSSLNMTTSGEYVQYTTFCRSFSPVTGNFSAYSTVVQPSIDGRNTNTISIREQVKGGFAPSGTRFSNTSVVFNDFEFPCTLNAGLVYDITDTIGLRTGKAILVDNVGATEEVFISSFVTDTSFTIAEALTTLTPANVVKVLFWGMHNVKLTSGDNADWYMTAFEFEPLPIEKSVLQARVAPEYEELIFQDIQTLSTASTSVVGVDMEPPAPNWANVSNLKTCDVELIEKNSTSTATEAQYAQERYRQRYVMQDTVAGTKTFEYMYKFKRQVNKLLDLFIRG